MQIKVNLIGIINDSKFFTTGNGFTDPKSGEAKLELNYSDCPPFWSPLLYCDPLALLPGYEEKEGGQSFLSMAKNGFKAYVNYDFSNGFLLRKTAQIRIIGDVIDAVYSIAGTLHINDKIETIEPFEEFLIPLEQGIIGGLGIATWKLNNGHLKAFVSSKYEFDKNSILNFPQKRKLIVNPNKTKSNLVFSADFKTSITPLIVPDSRLK